MLAIAASLTSGIPDQEQKFRTPRRRGQAPGKIRLPADKVLQQKPRNLIRNTILVKLHPILSQK